MRAPARAVAAPVRNALKRERNQVATADSRPSATTARAPVVRRADRRAPCACGGGCPRCRSSPAASPARRAPSPARLPVPKIAVLESDALEAEAVATAERVIALELDCRSGFTPRFPETSRHKAAPTPNQAGALRGIGSRAHECKSFCHSGFVVAHEGQSGFNEIIPQTVSRLFQPQ